MSGLSFSARDTVEGDTPKARAISLMVICGLFMVCKVVLWPKIKISFECPVWLWLKKLCESSLKFFDYLAIDGLLAAYVLQTIARIFFPALLMGYVYYIRNFH